MSEPESAAPPAPEKRKGFEFPGTLTVLVIVTFLVWLAAFLIPAGTYDRTRGAPEPGSFRAALNPGVGFFSSSICSLTFGSEP